MKSQEMTWGYDLGKGSIGEVVRLKKPGQKPGTTEIDFPHKKVWLFPPDFARRGPTTKTGTPASRYRAWKTRNAHQKREEWFDEIWQAAGLTPLHGRQVAGQMVEVNYKHNGILKKKKIIAGGSWHLVQKGDRRLESEAIGTKPEDCCSSCLLRVRLLRAGEKLTDWQVYKALRAAIQKRGYTPRQWRDWCEEFGVQPALDLKEIIEDAEEPEGGNQEPKAKKKKAFIVEPPSTEGRSRFSRPALRILNKLILSGLKPSELHKLLLNRDEQLLNELKLDILDASQIRNVGEKGREFIKQPRTWLLVSDLDFFSRMRNSEGQEDWDKFFIPSSNLDRLAADNKATEKERQEAIEKLIGQQNNPIVRHRLTAFWERIQALETKFGTPDRIVLELIRDDPESSWLGKDTVKEIIKFQEKNRERREEARKRLKAMPQYNNEEPKENTLTKFILWEQQGGECLYGRPAKEADNIYLETGLPFTKLDDFRIDHIVPRALGGSDSMNNKVLTDDDTNARKGDRTPFQWLHDDRIEQWQAFRARVLAPNKKLGGKKIRLLLSSDAEKLLSRYTPLAETAWIWATTRPISAKTSLRENKKMTALPNSRQNSKLVEHLRAGRKSNVKSHIAGIVFMQCDKKETGGQCVNFLKSNSMAQARTDSR